MTTDALTDHSAAIRAEMEADVRQLIQEVRRQPRDWFNDHDWEVIGSNPEPCRVILGYTVAMHRGRDLYQNGDIICGLPVVIDQYASREIRVESDDVEVVREVEVDDEDGGGYSLQHEGDTRRAEASTIW